MTDTPDPALAPDPVPDDVTPTVPRPDRRMLEALVCPVTQGTLTWDAAAQELHSPRAALAFPVRDGIPVMLVAEARKL